MMFRHSQNQSSTSNEFENEFALEVLKSYRLRVTILIGVLTSAQRLRGQETMGINKSPELNLDECRQLATDNQRGFYTVIERFEADGLDSLVTYRNLSGKRFTTSVGDILTHLAFHGTYHRGQIALTVRAEGGIPVDTDFITFTRETTNELSTKIGD